KTEPEKALYHPSTSVRRGRARSNGGPLRRPAAPGPGRPRRGRRAARRRRLVIGFGKGRAIGTPKRNTDARRHGLLALLGVLGLLVLPRLREAVPRAVPRNEGGRGASADPVTPPPCAPLGTPGPSPRTPACWGTAAPPRPAEGQVAQPVHDPPGAVVPGGAPTVP